MSAYYDLYSSGDVKQTGEKQPLYPCIVPKGTVDKDEFIERVSRFSHLNKSVLIGAMDAFQSNLEDLLANGWNVSMGDIGYFSLSLEGSKVMDKKDIRATSINLKNVNFRVNKIFKREIQNQLTLERKASLTRTEPSKCSLSERQAMVENFLKKNPFITRKGYERMTQQNKKQTLTDLNTFIKQGIIDRYGGGKMVVYILHRT